MNDVQFATVIGMAWIVIGAIETNGGRTRDASISYVIAFAAFVIGLLKAV